MGWSKKCQFWPDLAIQPIKKTIGVSHLPPHHHWKPFNLIWAHSECVDLEILEISDFWTCPNPCVKDFRILDLSKPLRQRFQNFGLLDFQVPRYLKSGLGRAGLGPWAGPWQCFAGARRRAAAKISEFWTYWNPCVKDFRILDLLEPLCQIFPDFQTPPTTTEELSDPNLTPLPTHPGIKYVARALAVI